MYVVELPCAMRESRRLPKSATFDGKCQQKYLPSATNITSLIADPKRCVVMHFQGQLIDFG